MSKDRSRKPSTATRCLWGAGSPRVALGRAAGNTRQEQRVRWLPQKVSLWSRMHVVQEQQLILHDLPHHGDLSTSPARVLRGSAAEATGVPWAKGISPRARGTPLGPWASNGPMEIPSAHGIPMGFPWANGIIMGLRDSHGPTGFPWAHGNPVGPWESRRPMIIPLAHGKPMGIPWADGISMGPFDAHGPRGVPRARGEIPLAHGTPVASAALPRSTRAGEVERSPWCGRSWRISCCSWTTCMRLQRLTFCGSQRTRCS
mmetsp:Transcript_58103/g.189196  ORF Transcript_58103/g.189196 Transcript_58103/m.189196 type:complete len:259 (+) Transcript_58103:452-1228(+)